MFKRKDTNKHDVLISMVKNIEKMHRDHVKLVRENRYNSIDVHFAPNIYVNELSEVRKLLVKTEDRP